MIYNDLFYNLKSHFDVDLPNTVWADKDNNKKNRREAMSNLNSTYNV